MRRPSQTYLVIVAGTAQATFDDIADARAYTRDTQPAGDDTDILCLPHWPTGMWLYGVETPTGPRATPGWSHTTPAPLGPSPVIEAQHRDHIRVNRRCQGAAIDIVHRRHQPPRYRCQRCGDLIL
jgi:hypothetical protein